jgi:hypothetical protein
MVAAMLTCPCWARCRILLAERWPRRPSLPGSVRVLYILRSLGMRRACGNVPLQLRRHPVFNFLPGGISGDAVRALVHESDPDHRLAILGAMVLDRVLGLVSMVFLGLVAALYMAINAPHRPTSSGSRPVSALIGSVALLHFVGGRHRHDERRAKLFVEKPGARSLAWSQASHPRVPAARSYSSCSRAW